MSDEWDALFERIRSKTHTDEDVETLQQMLGRVSAQHTPQEGKYRFEAEAGTFNIGDHYGFGLEELREILETFKPHVTSEVAVPIEHPNSYAKEIPLPTLSTEPELIERLNSRLITLEEISKSGHLPDRQMTEFNTIKSKLSSIEERNQELSLISNDVDRILNQSIQALSQKLQELSISQDERLLEARSQICISQQIQILERFQEELRGGKVVSRWLKRNKNNLSDLLIEHVLATYPQLRTTSSEKKLKRFAITIGQFIERLNYCLEWGRLDSLENPVTPIVMDDFAYAEAFEKLKQKVPEHMPEDGKSQLMEYIEYLQNSLKRYNHVNID